MMSRKNDVIRKIQIIIGVCLLAAATILLFVWQWNIHASEQKAKEYVSVIRELIPEPQGAVPEEKRDNTMSTLTIDGTDFVGMQTVCSHQSLHHSPCFRRISYDACVWGRHMAWFGR